MAGSLRNICLDEYNENHTEVNIKIYMFSLRVQFMGGGTFRRRRFGGADSAPPIRRWTTRRRAVSAPDISAPFHNFFLFLDL